MKRILLEKKNQNGKKIFWETCIEGSTYETSFGQYDGKIQKEQKTFLDGKNIGKKNETTPEQQCLLFVTNRARKKIDGGYEIIEGADIIEENTFKTVQETHDIPGPMLAHVFKDHIKKFDNVERVILQPKLDGNRCLINTKTGKMYSRNKKLIVSCPHISEAVVNGNYDFTEWLDGELYSDDLTFNEIQSIARCSKNIDYEKTNKINFFFFDYLSDEKQCDRAKRINLMPNDKCIIPVSSMVCDIPVGGNAMDFIKPIHDTFVEAGYEGVMIRKYDGLYESKRSYNIYKYKEFMDAEFEIVGYKHEKNDPTKLGSFICKFVNTKSEDDTFDARPKMTKGEIENIFANIGDYIGQFATVEFQNYDEITGSPRFPRIKGFRFD